VGASIGEFVCAFVVIFVGAFVKEFVDIAPHRDIKTPHRRHRSTQKVWLLPNQSSSLTFFAVEFADAVDADVEN